MTGALAAAHREEAVVDAGRKPVLAVVGALVIKLQQWIDRKVAPWVHHG